MPNRCQYNISLYHKPYWWCRLRKCSFQQLLSFLASNTTAYWYQWSLVSSFVVWMVAKNLGFHSRGERLCVHKTVSSVDQLTTEVTLITVENDFSLFWGLRSRKHVFRAPSSSRPPPGQGNPPFLNSKEHWPRMAQKRSWDSAFTYDHKSQYSPTEADLKY